MSRLSDNMLIDLKFNGDFGVTPTGDIETITGRDNLRQALFHRLITVPGSLAHRPGYGVGIKRYQNAIDTIDQKRDLVLKIQEQFAQDRRVLDVIAVRFTQDEINPGKFTVLVKVRAVGYNEFDTEFDPFKVI